MKKNCSLLSVFCLLLFFSGCVSLRESAKKLWGSSVVHLERTRHQGGSIEVPLAAAVCFQKTKEIIAQSGAVIYLEDKDMRYFAAMNFKGHVDTTQAGIFFTKLDDQRTRLEVGSMSPSLRSQIGELVSEKFFRQRGESVPSTAT